MDKLTLVLAAASLSAIPLVTSAAPPVQPKNYGYAVDTAGQIIRNGYNECWRTYYWTKDLAIAECDPRLVKAEAPVQLPPPVVAAPPLPSPPETAIASPVVAKAAPEPAALPAQKISLAGKTLFAVGKAELSPSAKVQIDSAVVARLSDFSSIESIRIAGHTDPTGDARRNNDLSKARAEAVKAYLVAKNVPAGMITTEGKGFSEPLPSVRCDPRLPKARLAACYEPLRRIELEVRGIAKGSVTAGAQ
jgi:OmpA-OmpF porin, OOP family